MLRILNMNAHLCLWLFKNDNRSDFKNQICHVAYIYVQWCLLSWHITSHITSDLLFSNLLSQLTASNRSTVAECTNVTLLYFNCLLFPGLVDWSNGCDWLDDCSINLTWPIGFSCMGNSVLFHQWLPQEKVGGVELCFCESAGVTTPVTPMAATRLLRPW